MAEELGSGLLAGLLGLAAVGLYLTVRAKPVLADAATTPARRQAVLSIVMSAATAVTALALVGLLQPWGGTSLLPETLHQGGPLLALLSTPVALAAVSAVLLHRASGQSRTVAQADETDDG